MEPDNILSLRLEAARAAQERSRLALFATTLISFALLTAAWNSYLSFGRGLAFAFCKLAPGADETGIHKLQEGMLTEWVKSRWISIPPLGIEVCVDDAPELGAVALLVALTWLYLCVRREHYTIAYLLRDYADNRYDFATKWRVFHGINLFTVFTRIGHADEPVQSLVDEMPAEKEWTPIRRGITAIYYLPTMALAFVIALDIASLFMPSPVRQKAPPSESPCDQLFVVKLTTDMLIVRMINEAEFWELGSTAVWDLIALVLLYAVWSLNHRVRQFSKSSEILLEKFLHPLPVDRAAG